MSSGLFHECTRVFSVLPGRFMLYHLCERRVRRRVDPIGSVQWVQRRHKPKQKHRHCQNFSVNLIPQNNLCDGTGNVPFFLAKFDGCTWSSPGKGCSQLHVQLLAPTGPDLGNDDCAIPLSVLEIAKSHWARDLVTVVGVALFSGQSSATEGVCLCRYARTHYPCE